MSVVSTKSLLRKLLNILKAELSYTLSLFGIVRVSHLPTFISIEPVHICPLNPSDSRTDSLSNATTKELLTPKQFNHILEQIKNSVRTIQFFFKDEPLLNLHLPDMIKQAHKAGIRTIVYTNALLLTPLFAERIMHAGLNRIIVSINGMSEESYKKYHIGGTLHKALEGLTYLRRAKQETGSHTHIELQTLRLKSNKHEWEMMKRQYKVLGADSLTLKTTPTNNYKHTPESITTDSPYSRYSMGEDTLYQPKKKKRHIGHRIWTGCVITLQGEVLPYYDKAEHFSFGNIYTDTLQNIYHNQKANRFREAILRKRSNISICQNGEP